ncbi:fibrobacter succinogenes major paralogous domain-containing protein [Mucilaginibacter sp. BJC16-A38]|uniref:fibrobacter succinogenes major paralogous domain-containing protein n=1 Tax=Mucilaginibacter phenanthrenivorans TaxID=1234842 RepID=UPI0021577B5C|nr:fibrobacter succinogenes major paralogous domain-containing protein [Mucilaginibacter phenanthrenivorans]MCR8561074.1 fibrobacter succinogenes major paralogous domain-containing protein [Mucilaginibacter phenanthrenivorans]
MRQFLFVALLLIALTSGLCFGQQKRKTTTANNTVKTTLTNTDPGLTVGDTGKVTFIYQKKKVTYTTVRAKDGNIWLQQSLGSKRVAIDLHDEDSFGDLFQWGRWDDGHQLYYPANTRRDEDKDWHPIDLDKTGVNPFYWGVVSRWWRDEKSTDQWTAATPAEVTADNGCDPCKAMGEGWHLPSAAELQNIINLEYITDANGGWNSSLRLSLSGSRDGTNGTTIRFRGRSANFWTSTPDAALELVSGKVREFERGYGFAIRCLKSKK